MVHLTIPVAPSCLALPRVEAGRVSIRTVTVMCVVSDLFIERPVREFVTPVVHFFGEPRSLRRLVLADERVLRGPPMAVRLPSCRVCPPRIVRTTDSPKPLSPLSLSLRFSLLTAPEGVGVSYGR